MDPAYVPLIAPISAILGALLGAVVNSLLSSRNERLKWERDQRIRYNQDRVRAYGEFFAAIHTDMTELTRFWHDRLARGESFDGEILFPLDNIDHARAVAFAYNNVLLIATPAVREAARELHMALGHFTFVPCPKLGVASLEDALREKHIRLDKARERFFEAARAELGVPSS